MSKKTQLLVFILLVLLAASLRFYRLDWPFSNDELYTLYETKLFSGDFTTEEFVEAKFLNDYYDGSEPLEKSQLYRLPRVIPVAHFLHLVNYALFGMDESASRILPAAIGSLNVGIVFLLARPLFGAPGSLILSFVVLCFPEHIFNSQYNRFYSFSFFFISIVYLLGAHAVVGRSRMAAILIGPVAVLMVLCNTIAGIVWGTVWVGLLVEFAFSKRKNDRITWQILALFSIWSLILVGLAAFHILPFLKEWGGQWKGYSSLSALIAFVARIGWPAFLLILSAGLGMLFRIGENGSGYWLMGAVTSFLAVFGLPYLIVFHPWYTFLFSFPSLVLVALAIDQIRLGFCSNSPSIRPLGIACSLVFAALLNFPALVSYYSDGNRLDYRAACRYIQGNWRESDRVTTSKADFVEWYLPRHFPKLSFTTPEQLKEQMNDCFDGRLWVVMHCHRGGPDEKLLYQVTQRATFETKFVKKRFDHRENSLVLFLVDPDHVK